jgi:hypothetical protein
MFLSAGYLAIQYGVDDEIAKFFVDREPPAGNLYWKDKLLYLRFETGYIFIPLIVDLLFKLGVDKKELLCDPFVGLMEDIGHVSALEEANQINKHEALNQCALLAQKAAVNTGYLKVVNEYFLESGDHPFRGFETGFKALHRGDVFLYSLAALHLSPNQYNTVVQYWFALISTLLLLDDAHDIKADELNNDHNAFLEVGLTKDGILQLQALVQRNLQLLQQVNRPLALKLDKQVIDLFQTHFQQLLN